jgi:hypothetical protein
VFEGASMNQVDQLKEAIENISKKKHVISSEASYAKEIINSNKDLENEQVKLNLDKQHKLLDEFNVSIKLLMSIFKQSRFDEVMGFVAEPYKLILINSIIALFRGVFFGLGFILVSAIVAYFFKAAFFSL